MPLVSIIVPVYNAEKCVNKTLDALVGQTLKDIEIICVDDASTDGSLAVLKDYEARYPNLHAIAGPEKGAFLTRELGISNASGDYIGFCDADDIPEPNMYEQLLKTAQDSNADIAVCAYRRIDAKTGKTTVEMTGFGTSSYDVVKDKGWLVSVNTAVWNKLIKRELFNGHYIPENPPTIAEDAFLMLSLYEKASSIAFTTEPLYNYYVNEGSAMKTIDASQVDELFGAWRNLREHIAAEDAGYLDVLDLAAFIHLGVSLGSRLVKQKGFSLSRLLNQLDSGFPLQVDSKYLSAGYISAHGSMKTTKLAHSLKQVGLLPAALHVYAALDKALGSSIKW